ncbi:MAG: 30S ribosomal protein S7 [Anaerolineales bacterium]|nr:30S ribosomal protein S7 [Anaerolineales bacterium]
MSRRVRKEPRPVPPDVRYNSVKVNRFIHQVMHKGKKSTAVSIVYDAFDLVQERTQKDPLEVFEQALHNVGPQIEVKPRRVGGATYQVPIEVEADRRDSLAVRWILAASRSRGGKSMTERLAGELLDAANNTGSAVKKREEVHKMAEANRAYAHYRW